MLIELTSQISRISDTKEGASNMIKALVLLLMVLPCKGIFWFASEELDLKSNVTEWFLSAFHSPECRNPCWLGIEVGVTNKASAISILKQHGIEYDTDGVIHLNHIPDGLVPGMDSDGQPGPNGNAYGDINVAGGNESIVQSIDFYVDLCMSTVISTYGVPLVWFSEAGLPTTIVYVDRQMFLTIDPETKRVDGLILHDEAEDMPLPVELQDWSGYAHAFQGNCVDIFTEYLSGT